MNCGLGWRRSSGLALLWLWRRLAATAPIRPLTWKLTYASGSALKRQKKKKNQLRQRPGKGLLGDTSSPVWRQRPPLSLVSAHWSLGSNTEPQVLSTCYVLGTVLCFKHINYLNLHNNLIKEILLLLPPFSGWGDLENYLSRASHSWQGQSWNLNAGRMAVRQQVWQVFQPQAHDL